MNNNKNNPSLKLLPNVIKQNLEIIKTKIEPEKEKPNKINNLQLYNKTNGFNQFLQVKKQQLKRNNSIAIDYQSKSNNNQFNDLNIRKINHINENNKNINKSRNCENQYMKPCFSLDHNGSENNTHNKLVDSNNNEFGFRTKNKIKLSKK